MPNETVAVATQNNTGNVRHVALAKGMGRAHPPLGMCVTVGRRPRRVWACARRRDAGALSRKDPKVFLTGTFCKLIICRTKNGLFQIYRTISSME